MNENAAPSRPSFREAFFFWLKLGFISFGGPAGQIGIMHEFLVEKKKWISESRFLHALNYCMLLPGPEAQQLATYTGWLLHGARGGLAAGMLFVLPSVVILLALSIVYALYGKIEWVSSMFGMLKPAVVAIVIVALFKIAGRSLKGIVPLLFAAASFTAIFFFNVPFPLIIITAVALALTLKWLAPALVHNRNSDQKLIGNESSYYINCDTKLSHTSFSAARLTLQVVITVVLWLIPFLLLVLLTSDTSFWKTLTLFFTKAAFVTFGGAYAVLPYVAQVSVEKYGWLSSLEMIDGLALGETTPGPLIMVLAFVGFMAGFNHYGNSVLHGTAGLLVTVYYTFLPCFLFIFAGAPLIERTQQNTNLKAVMNLVSAAVVGVILNLTIYFGVAVVIPEGLEELKTDIKTMIGILPVPSDRDFIPSSATVIIDFIALAWIVISFFALYRFKVNMILWIAISAIVGLVVHLLTGAAG
jgi:chromate transporter